MINKIGADSLIKILNEEIQKRKTAPSKKYYPSMGSYSSPSLGPFYRPPTEKQLKRRAKRRKYK